MLLNNSMKSHEFISEAHLTDPLQQPKSTGQINHKCPKCKFTTRYADGIDRGCAHCANPNKHEPFKEPVKKDSLKKKSPPADDGGDYFFPQPVL